MRPIVTLRVTFAVLKVVVTLPVIGSNGQMAQAQVSSAGQGELNIQVQLSNGRIIQVGSGADDDYDQFPGNDEYAPKGRVVDADWREIR